MGRRTVYNVIAFILLATSLVSLPEALVDGIAALTDWRVLFRNPFFNFSENLQDLLGSWGIVWPLWIVSLVYFLALSIGLVFLYVTNIAAVEQHLTRLYDQNDFDELESELGGFNNVEGALTLGGLVGMGTASAGLKAAAAGAAGFGPPGWLIALGLLSIGTIIAVGHVSEERKNRIQALRRSMELKIAVFRQNEIQKLILAGVAVLVLVILNFALPPLVGIFPSFKDFIVNAWPWS
ncbi:MAG: hypothetical protein ACK41P_00340 [Asticcacaulis sp.]